MTVANLGRDLRSSLQVGDWVEIVGETSVHQQRAEPLRQVDVIVGRQITLRALTAGGSTPDIGKHAIFRRWDQKQGDSHRGGLDLHEGGAALIKESGADKIWLSLEDGIQIQFAAPDPPNRYRRGNYWLIPARVATGDLECPSHEDDPEELPPHGVDHHYAPLALLEFNPGNALYKKIDTRLKFQLPKVY